MDRLQMIYVYSKSNKSLYDPKKSLINILKGLISLIQDVVKDRVSLHNQKYFVKLNYIPTYW